ncbi:interleukin-18 receptor 1-like [Stegastes partitus]|uniref:Interleukin-18 receptor 1-like n=1 Tax=Stegastes partitus TaxID=144197 RepID=A0A3B5AR68_9TELE|nr:PREDICTED: interleukin-18 receptor 1-like [Stegastes partitus]
MAIFQLLFFTLTAGVCPVTSKEIRVKAGEIVALYCEGGDGKTLWKSNSSQGMYLYNKMSATEQRQIGVVVHENILVILNASINHQGNYECSSGNTSSQHWINLTVYTQSKDMYSRKCFTEEFCKLYCPDIYIPADKFTSKGTTWNKEAPENGEFSSVEEKHSGVYTCTKSYLYHGQTYNVTFRVNLSVLPHKKRKTAEIQKPRNNEEFQVELGSPKVINCEAFTHSDTVSLFWFSGETFFDKKESSPVYYNTTWNNTEKKMTASLVFTKVLEEHLSKNYTCKLENDIQTPKFVTITLTRKARPSYISLAVCIVFFVVVSVVTVVIYVKFKVDISLFLRDTLGCHSSTSDGKSYDAFLMCYKSDTDEGLNAQDRKTLESVLEERFGYSLCLYDRDILPGNAVAQAVLDCIEQSRTVVLVPTSPDPGLGSGLLSVIHEALVEKQTRLVFINTETPEMSNSGSLQDALQLLSEAGNHVTWKGMSSMLPSSSFWKQLRYYLPAPQHAPKMQLLPQTVQDVN